MTQTRFTVSANWLVNALCEYYFQKYNVDVRSIRYPGIIGKSPPGGGIDYAIAIFLRVERPKPILASSRRSKVCR